MYKNDIMEKETTGRRYVPPMMRVVCYHLDEEMAQTPDFPALSGAQAGDDDDKVKAWRDDLNEEWTMTSTPVQNGNGVWDKAW